jgi:putative flippase GtrA
MSAELQPGIKAQAPFTRWLKFNFVGGIGMVVQVAVLFLLKSQLRLHYLWATVIAVEAAILHNFVWHEQFTWADRSKPDRVRLTHSWERRWRKSLARLGRFNLANGSVSILGNLVLMRVIVGEGHLNYLAGNGIAIALCSLANFVVSDAWVFAK